MNDRLKIAAMLAQGDFAAQGENTGEWNTQIPQEFITIRCRLYLRFADALIAAAGEKAEAGDADFYKSMVRYRDEMMAELRRAEAAEAEAAKKRELCDLLQSQLTAALADNERMRGAVVSRAEYDRQVAEADEWKRCAEAHRAKYDAAVLEIASLKRQLEPLTNDEVHLLTKEYGMFPNAHNCGIVEAWERSIASVKARRGE